MLNLLGPHIHSHHIFHELVAHATRYITIFDQIPGKELDAIELRSCPHISQREVAIEVGPNPLGLLNYLTEDGEGISY
jgi:hypothetical protein